MTKNLKLIFWFLLISQNIAIAQEHSAPVEGIWYSEFWEDFKDGTDPFLRLSISERLPDQSFKFTMYKCSSDGLEWLATEYGNWSYKNGTYKTSIFKIEDPIGTENVLFFEQYNLLESSKNKIKYQSLRTKNVYENKRVDKDYKVLCQELVS